jgi:FKBP-type peptidyl-prolyl cis-trans isomerase
MMRISLISLMVLAAVGCGEGGTWTKTYPSGVKYLDLAEGEGRPVEVGDHVRITFIGWLARGGTVFAKTEGEGPSELTVGGGDAIKGWDEALLGMKPGGKRRIFMPASEAYGQAKVASIPPGSDLMFEVELVGYGTRYDGEKESVGWKKSPTGLRMHDVKVGEGAEARPGARVTVHYVGRLAKGGKEFDNSRKNKRAFELTLGMGEVIAGWDEGLVGMKVGGVRKLFIPWALAYGEAGDREIPPKADLVFEVELLDVTGRP